MTVYMFFARFFIQGSFNYLCFGKPHRLKSDERKEERKRGMKYERKSLKSGKEERNRIGKSLTTGKGECKRRTENSAPQAKKKLNCICTKP